MQKWMTFASEYIKERGKKTKAVFIFDMESEIGITSKKGIKQFSFDDYIGEYDRIVFSVLVSSGVKENSFIKKYLSELVSNVSGNDIELCAECIENYKEFLANPLELLQKVCENMVRSDGAPFSYDKTKEEVEYLIWLSQIKTIYPHLEEYREDFVRKYASSIKKQLPISASYGEVYEDPKDVELDTLKYMVDNGYITLTTMEYERLKRFKEARNRLSHLSFLLLDEIRAII